MRSGDIYIHPRGCSHIMSAGREMGVWQMLTIANKSPVLADVICEQPHERQNNINYTKYIGRKSDIQRTVADLSSQEDSQYNI